MSRKRAKRLEILAWSLSGDETRCPIPSAHDRLSESHYFLHEMERTYHEPDPFRYNLHAFIQAFESTISLLLIETQGDPRFAELRARLQARLATEQMQKFKSVRDAAVHRESLVPDSRVSVGWFKYGRPKLCIRMPINPLLSSLEVMTRFRNDRSLVNLQRMWEGEEVGILREWRLHSVSDGELLSECAARLTEVSEFVAVAHKCAGGKFIGGQCGASDSDCRTLLESDYFPEVLKAWEGQPTETIVSVVDELLLRDGPLDSSKVLHRASKGSAILACVGGHPIWSNKHSTAIIFSIDGRDIRKDTAVFFEKSKASVTPIPRKEDEDETEDE